MRNKNIRIYCDESCHLQNDHFGVMSFGALQCPSEKVRQVSLDIRNLKNEYFCKGELKWTKVSPKNLDFYKELVRYFSNNKYLNFRILIVMQKERLDHSLYNEGEHDNFYYKMYYYLLHNIIKKKNNFCYEIFLDIKDTKSSLKIKSLREVLSNSLYDFEMFKIQNIQQIRSNESNLLQLCDFLLGAITYFNRGNYESPTKQKIATELANSCNTNFKVSTPPWEEKINLFHFTPKESKE